MQKIAAIVLGLTWIGGGHAQQLSATVVFSQGEIETIQAYYREQTPGQATPGRRVSRGVAKNLERGKMVPPGIAKRNLPINLAAQLPPAPAGHERIVVAGKILLVDVATQAIRDVLTDVLLR
jgi:hypothetical protein